MKLVEMAIVMVLDTVEDEQTFFTLNFVKSKFCNQLITNLNLVVCMHNNNFIRWNLFLSTLQFVSGPKEKFIIVSNNNLLKH
jgi:hypothetical protein